MLQRQHERVGDQRKDYLNKLAHDLVGRYDRIALEDLTITRMVHGNLAKRSLDAGWGYLVQRLTHKAASAGRVVVLVESPVYIEDVLRLWCAVCGPHPERPLGCLRVWPVAR